MIEINGLSVQTKGFSIKDVSLKVQPGSCHCLIGPTGCGKTTLLEAVLGLRKIKKGTIILEGRDITNLPVNERGFSYVPQDLAIFPHLSVEENILYGIRHGRLPNKNEGYKLAYELAESLGITHLLKRRITNLSGGEKQRVALARALAPGHKYLLLDEPFSALHEGMKRELWFLIKELQRRYGFTILMVSHDIEETFFLSDYVSVMIDGSIRQAGPKDMVFSRPATLDVARFFGIRNILEAEIRGIQDGKYRLYCDDVRTEVLLPVERTNKKHQIGERVLFGIKPEDVIILRPDLQVKSDNLLNGKVIEIHQMGTRSMVIIKPDTSERVIEILMPQYALTKLNLKKSMPVTVSLESERLFVLG